MLRKAQIFSVAVIVLNFLHFLELPISKAELTQRGNCLGDSNVFFYFAYGSNMLGKRLSISKISTAIRIGSASLEAYRLDFDQRTLTWAGARATISPDRSSTTFGSLWQIDQIEMENLDKQEGVHQNVYRPMNVSVKLLSNGAEVTARTYILTDEISTDPQADRRPSETYLKCIVKGAQESGLPLDYIDHLKAIKHNGVIVEKLEEDLDLQNIHLTDSE